MSHQKALWQRTISLLLDTQRVYHRQHYHHHHATSTSLTSSMISHTSVVNARSVLFQLQGHLTRLFDQLLASVSQDSSSSLSLAEILADVIRSQADTAEYASSDDEIDRRPNTAKSQSVAMTRSMSKSRHVRCLTFADVRHLFHGVEYLTSTRCQLLRAGHQALLRDSTVQLAELVRARHMGWRLLSGPHGGACGICWRKVWTDVRLGARRNMIQSGLVPSTVQITTNSRRARKGRNSKEDEEEARRDWRIMSAVDVILFRCGHGFHRRCFYRVLEAKNLMHMNASELDGQSEQQGIDLDAKLSKHHLNPKEECFVCHSGKSQTRLNSGTWFEEMSLLNAAVWNAGTVEVAS